MGLSWVGGFLGGREVKGVYVRRWGVRVDEWCMLSLCARAGSMPAQALILREFGHCTQVNYRHFVEVMMKDL